MGAAEMKAPPLLVKLLMMTTSTHDAEALVAIRKANAILGEMNLNWAEFLSGVEAKSGAQQEDNSWRQKPSERQKRRQSNDDNAFSQAGNASNGRTTKYDNQEEINRYFDLAFNNTDSGSSFMSFLESVFEWWEDKGFLTEKQYYAVRG